MRNCVGLVVGWVVGRPALTGFWKRGAFIDPKLECLGVASKFDKGPPLTEFGESYPLVLDDSR